MIPEISNKDSPPTFGVPTWLSATSPVEEESFNKLPDNFAQRLGGFEVDDVVGFDRHALVGLAKGHDILGSYFTYR